MIGYYKSLDTSNQLVNKRHNIFRFLYVTNLNKQLSHLLLFSMMSPGFHVKASQVASQLQLDLLVA